MSNASIWVIVAVAVICGLIGLFINRSKPKYKRPPKRQPKLNSNLDKSDERRFRRDNWH